MAGYMTKLQGYVYEGELRNGTGGDVTNGMLLTLGAAVNGKIPLVKPAANTNTKFTLKEIGTIYDGTKAYRFVVKTLGAQPLYFVENAADPDEGVAYDGTEVVCKNGELCRAHPLVVGEEFLVSAGNTSLTAGTDYSVQTTGLIG